MNVGKKIQNSNLNIRVSKQLIEEFEKACDGVPKSIVLRMLMQDFIDDTKPRLILSSNNIYKG